MYLLKVNNQTMENKITDRLVNLETNANIFQSKILPIFLTSGTAPCRQTQKIICSKSFNWVFILFFSVVIVLLSIPIHLCEVLSIEIGSYLAQSSDFENLAENPTIPAETGVEIFILASFLFVDGCSTTYTSATL